MDRFIAAWAATADGDLMLCRDHGVAYQRDMAHRVSYDAAYFDKCAGYEDQAIALKINAGRVALVNNFVNPAFPVLDVGIGSGEFLKKRPNTFGYDINPKAVAWLKDSGRWSEDFPAFPAFTFWDVIEHVEDPEEYFRHVPIGGHLFCSLPIFDDLRRIRESRHYRPGEHLYYWTVRGFVDWIGCHGFVVLEVSDFETRAGRESILSFAFQRDADHAGQ